jgi:hypothetical protein
MYRGPQPDEYEGDVLLGGQIQFAFAVFALDPVFFQWRHDGMILPGETNRSLLRTNLTYTDSGSYDAILSNRYGSLTSRVARLEVVPVEIDSLSFFPFYGPQPEGTNVILQVYAYGKAPLIYQWYFQGKPMADGTNAILALPNIMRENAGSYVVVVSNSDGTNSSGAIELAVILRPQLAIRRLADAVELIVTEGAGARRVQSSANFLEWTTIYSDQDGPSPHQITRPTDQPRQFYRVVSP